MKSFTTLDQFKILLLAQIKGFTGLRKTVFAFEEMFLHVLGKCSAVLPQHKFKFNKESFSLDSTAVSLCLSLCKWQNLKIKKFMGNSKDAIYTQIWTALIYYRILSYLKFKNKWSQSLLYISRVVREVFEESFSIAEMFRFKRKRDKMKLMDPFQISLFRPILTEQ